MTLPGYNVNSNGNARFSTEKLVMIFYRLFDSFN